MKKRMTVLIMIVISLSISSQQPMFKALFIFNFAKYIEWPSSSESKEFTIGIYGSDNVEVELNKLASSRKINAKTIVVKKVKSLEEANGVQIFYVPNSKSSEISKVAAHFKNSPTLIVSDKPNMCTKGAHINYVVLDGKMKFEVNKSEIVSHNLNVDPKLISLGIEVK